MTAIDKQLFRRIENTTAEIKAACETTEVELREALRGFDEIYGILADANAENWERRVRAARAKTLEFIWE